MTSDHNSSELGIQDHINEPSSSKLVLKVVPPADKIAISQQELELIFSPMYEEYFNAGNQKHPSDTQVFTVKMEILLELTSNKLLHQDSRIKKAQKLKIKTSPNSDIKDNSSETKLRGRLLESFQEDAKYEHVGQDTRSQDGKDDQDKQGKDLKILESNTKSKDNDKGSRSKITKHEGTSLQHNKDQRLKNLTTKQYQEVQGRKIQDLTSRIQRPHIRGDC
ncbi:hypothetical protein Tco_0247582 [Tanacetum coccineum]